MTCLVCGSLTEEQKIAHGGHPVLRWMMDNIYIHTDPAGNIKADKEKSTEKIDGTVATIMGLDRAIPCGNQNTGQSSARLFSYHSPFASSNQIIYDKTKAQEVPDAGEERLVGCGRLRLEGTIMRQITEWNDNWNTRRAADGPDAAFTAVTLPWTWNAVDGQDGGNDYYRGTYEFEKVLCRPEMPAGSRLILEITAAANTAEVFMNGKFLGRHDGGFSIYRVDLTDELRDENRITIFVDNSENDCVYPQKADFTFYGGLYRGVKLIEVPAEHFELIQDGTPGIRVTPEIDLTTGTATVTAESRQNAGPVTYTIQETGDSETVPSENGYAKAVFTIEKAHLWDGVNDPFLYTLTASLESGDEISVRFGIRQIRIESEGFFLNGRAYPLRGVSKHQDRWGVGNAMTEAMLDEDMGIIKELGANAVRLAHYQHPQYFYDLCDENGIMVWAEIPYITQHMTNGKENAQTQMRELITQCYNHPCICCWGLSNEITVSGGVTEELLNDHKELNDLCHRMDASRPTTMAHAFMLEPDSPLIDVADAGAYNLYFGWYLGSLEQNDAFFDEYHAQYPHRAIGFSEYGADTNPAFHSASPEAGDYTEEYQCVYQEHILNLIEERPYLWCTFAWNLFDFGADGRDEGGKHGLNQKGLVTIDRSLKKDAFYLYKAAWSSEPFVYICGRRYVNRAEDVTQVKVYSNQPSVALSVDGIPVGKQEGKRTFEFKLPITGKHLISAQAGGCTDSIEIRKVGQPDESYLFQKETVVNWFDWETLRGDCFSVNDTLGEMLSHPKAGAIVKRLIEQAGKSRGDVAAATSGNENMLKMMSGMTLSALLKKAGDAISEEQAKAFNDMLQKIPKK